MNRDLSFVSTESVVFLRFISINSLLKLFTVCKYPEPTNLTLPVNNETEVYNFNVAFSWIAYDSAMTGSPCAAYTSTVATVFLLLDREQDLVLGAPQTAVFNTTPSDNQFTATSSHFIFVKLTSSSSNSKHHILLDDLFHKWQGISKIRNFQFFD